MDSGPSYKRVDRCASHRGPYIDQPTLTSRFHLANWINEDGTKPTTYIGYDTAVNAIFLAGNITLFNKVFSDDQLVEVVSQNSL